MYDIRCSLFISSLCIFEASRLLYFGFVAFRAYHAPWTWSALRMQRAVRKTASSTERTIIYIRSRGEHRAMSPSICWLCGPWPVELVGPSRPLCETHAIGRLYDNVCVLLMFMLMYVSMHCPIMIPLNSFALPTESDSWSLVYPMRHQGLTVVWYAP
jgi:hypothetical protein